MKDQLPSFTSQDIPLEDKFNEVRALSERLCSNLTAEDYLLQGMQDTSPPKWHLAHTTWFFEEVILKKYMPNYQEFDQKFSYLFNSYYEAVGSFYPRAQRGLLSRPSVEEIFNYREYVNEHVLKFCQTLECKENQDILNLLVLGCHHEQQHQELLLMDIKYSFSLNPLYPALFLEKKCSEKPTATKNIQSDWLEIPSGLSPVGTNIGDDFSYDNERPQHLQYIYESKIAGKHITNAQFLEFVEDGSYKKASLWLSKGWHKINKSQWHSPLYWRKLDGQWFEFTLFGLNPLNMNEPVSHVSYYEADAFARWRGGQLPTEGVWETAARLYGAMDNCGFLDAKTFHPQVENDMASSSSDLMASKKFYLGNVWDWTQSSYLPYPGYKPFEGLVAEYNGKFMCGQNVLRGGSCFTPKNHFRKTYRNFFYPDDRWQCSGIRLSTTSIV